MTTLSKQPSMTNAVKGGILYAAGVFTIGFGLGVLRYLFLVPIVTETWAVFIELPIILSFSWMLCSRSTALLKVPEKAVDRLIMGMVAMLVLISAEFALWSMMFQEPTAGFFARYKEPAGMTGLMGQMVFAMFPLIQLRSSQSKMPL